MRRSARSRWKSWLPVVLLVGALCVLVPLRARALLEVPVQEVGPEPTVVRAEGGPARPALLIDGGLPVDETWQISANRRFFASYSAVDGVQVWDLRENRPVFSLPAPDRGCLAAHPLDISDDGRRLLCGLDNDDVLWDVETDRPLLTLRGPFSWSMSPDGHALLARGFVVSLWDADRAVRLASFETSHASFLAAGNLLKVEEQGQPTRYTYLRLPDLRPVNSPDQDVPRTSDPIAGILLDVAKTEMKGQGCRPAIDDTSLSPDQRWLAVRARRTDRKSGETLIFDMSGPRCVARIRSDDKAFESFDRIVWGGDSVAVRSDDRIEVRSLRGTDTAFTLRTPTAAPNAMALSHDGRILAVSWPAATRAQTVSLYEVRSRRLVARTTTEMPWADRMEFSPHGRGLTVATDDYKTLRLHAFEIQRHGTETRLVRRGEVSHTGAWCYTPSGRLFACDDYHLVELDALTLTVRRKLPLNEPLRDLTPSPDGRHLLASTSTYPAKRGERVALALWNVAEGRVIRVQDAEAGTFSADGRACCLLHPETNPSPGPDSSGPATIIRFGRSEGEESRPRFPPILEDKRRLVDPTTGRQIATIHLLNVNGAIEWAFTTPDFDCVASPAARGRIWRYERGQKTPVRYVDRLVYDSAIW